MSTFYKTAFTLIELLVVIAIIGILSGLIIVGMNGMTQKANIAKSQVFSNSLRNALMMNTVGEWRLNGDAVDTWGNNDGTILGATSSSECIYDSCLSFSGANQYVDLGSDSSLVSVFDNGKAFTYAVWFYPTSLPSAWYWLVCKAYTSHVSPYYQIQLIYRSSSYLRSNVYNNAGGDYIPNVNVLISLNNWYFVAVSVDLSNNTQKLYLNGIQVDQSSGITGTYTNHATVLNLSSNRNIYTSNAYNFIGKMDELKLYSSVIPVSQIKEQYYAGLNKLFADGNISKEDYQNRVHVLTTAER